MFEELTDDELLLLARTRPEAFGAFYRRHAEALLRFFARRTFDPEAAAELTAETFASALAARGRFRPRGGGAEAWLYGIARHQLAHFFRRGAVDARARQRIGLPEQEVSDADYERIEELVDFDQVRRAVADAFSLLSDEQREAVTLRVVEGRPYAEVAEALVCTEQAARARVSRGLKRLSGLLEGQVPELGAKGT
ncbi:MAG: sigma-70 family RNA polymerase sigma factor [Actinomycetota bacterium]|nr:sigma-70 family RNA polymerase sigma factor [Actinomycetota bacterium]